MSSSPDAAELRPEVSDAAGSRRATTGNWLIWTIVAIGMAATLAMTWAAYRNAQHEWQARADRTAQGLSNTLLGWIEESYAPLSGLAAVLENSPDIAPGELLNSFEGMESRASANLLVDIALLRPVPRGKWEVVVASARPGTAPGGGASPGMPALDAAARIAAMPIATIVQISQLPVVARPLPPASRTSGRSSAASGLLLIASPQCVLKTGRNPGGARLESGSNRSRCAASTISTGAAMWRA